MTPSEPAVVDVRRLHPLSPFFELILLARQFAVPVVLLLVAGRGDGSQFLPALPVAVASAFGFARWWRFTYTFDGGRLIVDEGVLTRKQRIIPIDRVQQVELVRRLRHRLFGVAVLRVDTAGGGGAAEVNLSVVSMAEAARLRALLRTEAAPAPVLAAEAEAAAEAAAPALVRIGPARLALAGMTGSELAIMLTILFWIVQLVDDLPDSFVHDLAGHLTAPTSLGGFLLGLGALLVVWFGLAAAAAILKNFGFTMTRAGHDLRVARGLLDRREGTMPVHRLQAIRIRQTLVRRALRLVEVVLQSAGQATSNGRGVSRIDVPILDEGALAPLLEELLPAAPPEPATYRPAPPAARRRAILRRAVPAAAIAVVLGVAAPRLIPLGVLLVVLAVAAGELAYRGLAHAWERELLVVRAGGLARETVVVPAAKAQSTRLRTSPLQRRAGLATLFVDVAGKGHTPRIRDGDVDRLRHLQAAILLASPAARADEARLRRREALG